MKLLSMKAHNVFSIGTVELDLNDRGLTLVTGWSYDDNNGNMAGKSSIASRAIIWGLYGKTVDGIKADDVINTSVPHAKHCGVTIHFQTDDLRLYRIMRQRKPNELSLAVLNHYDPDTGDEWDELTQRNEKDTQELIDKLLGRDHKTFIQSDFFGQGRERSFLSLPGSEQRAVIEEILPLTSLDAWQTEAKKQIHNVENKIQELSANLRVSSALADSLKSQGDSFKAQFNAWNTDRTIQISSAQSKLNDIRRMSSGLDKEILLLMEALPSGISVEDTLATQTREANKLSSTISTLQYACDEATKEIDRRLASPDTCLACGQSYPEDKLQLNATAIENTKAVREQKLKEKNECEVKLYNANATIAICHEVQAIQKKIGTKDQEEMLVDKIEALKKATNPYEDIRVSNHTAWSLEISKKELIGLKLATEHERLEHLKFWNNAFGSDLKTLLFNQVCPFLEERANQYLKDLNNGQIKVRFSTVKEMKSGDTKDQFCVTASSDTGSQIFELFSGAEKQLTSFAVGMALSDLAGMQTEGASSFMILDEPFLYQSPENCENIVNFITHNLGDKSTILLISNEDNLVNLIPNRVHVVKRKGVTSIE